VSTRRRILVIGSGKRVTQAALPVLDRAREEFELLGIVSRTPKTIHSEGHEHQVESLETITAELLASVDIIYMVVAKPAVPTLLARLARFDLSRIEMLIETPVMLFRHLGHLKRLAPFRSVWVSEDTTTMPCFDPLRSNPDIGDVQSVHFERSAYAYHGLAMVKTVLGGGPVRRARQRQLPGGLRERRITMQNGREAVIIDPRDYSLGQMTFTGSRRTCADNQHEEHLLIEPILEAKRCLGFRAGDLECRLDEGEASLIGEPGDGDGLTAWIDGMKRIGFLRLLRSIAAGRGAYPLEEAVEDAVVDYHLEKLGRYYRTPLTDPRSGLARLSYSILTRLAGR
jgi:hypothetical protein